MEIQNERACKTSPWICQGMDLAEVLFIAPLPRLGNLILITLDFKSLPGAWDGSKSGPSGIAIFVLCAAESWILGISNLKAGGRSRAVGAAFYVTEIRESYVNDGNQSSGWCGSGASHSSGGECAGV